MSRLIDEHRRYLADASRIRCFRSALAETVRPGDVVVDLAAGTGILGLLACEAGAARVFAVDEGPILDFALKIAAANGWGDRFVPIRERSTRATLPERADVIVTDQIGQFGIEAGLVQDLRDASRRWLKPGGRTVPASVDLWVAPMESAELRARIDFWGSAPSGIDVSVMQHAASNSGHPHHIRADDLVGRGCRIAALDLDPSGPDMVRGGVDLSVDRDGYIDGVAGWFVAQLSASVTMTNAPDDPNRISRRQVCLPLSARCPVRAGDAMTIALVMRPADLLVNWTVTVTPRDGSAPRTFRQSTLDGMLIGRDDVRRSRPDFLPTLTPAGAARRSVLELCDGRRRIEDIEREMRRRHGDLLPDSGSAAAFVAEVLAVYAR